jgi:DNA polymerase-1
MYMHHALHPSDSHSLAYLASVFTRQPYWKDDPKEGLSSSWELLGSPEDFYHYNCMDAAVTLELWGVLKEFLVEHDKMVYYEDHYARLFDPLLRAGLNGMRVNSTLRATREQENKETLADLFTALAEKVGHDLRSKGKRKGEVGKGLSTGKIAAFLYGKLGLPIPRVKDDKGTFVAKRKTDEITIRRATLNTEEMREIGPLILQVRRQQQLGVFLNADRYVDDRLYYQFKMNTEAGRLSSSMNPLKEGSNLQNQDREIRDIFYAEPGQLIMEMDASQIESRYVYAMTGDPKLYELANAKPWEADMHKENAAAMFGVSLADVTKDQRQSGKIVSHGCQRDMQGKRLSDTYLKDHGMVVSKEVCQKQINTYHAARPAIKRWFASVRSTLTTHRKLTNSWGRTLYFPYAFYPQSECADHINQLGVRVWHERVRHSFPGAVLLGQVHDSMIWSLFPEQAWGVYTAMRLSLEQPRMILGKPLVVPMEAKIGPTWAGSVEFKKPPAKSDFNDLIMALPTAPLWG